MSWAFTALKAEDALKEAFCETWTIIIKKLIKNVFKKSDLCDWWVSLSQVYNQHPCGNTHVKFRPHSLPHFFSLLTTQIRNQSVSLFLPFFGYEQEVFSYIQLNMKIHTHLQNQNCNSTLETVNIIHSFRRTHCLMRKPSIPTVTAGDTIAQAVISLVNFHILPSVF